MGRGKRRQRWYERNDVFFDSAPKPEKKKYDENDGKGCSFVQRQCRGDISFWRSPEGTFLLPLCDHHVTKVMPHAAGYAEVTIDVREADSIPRPA
jgi:hypothetical protein